MARRLTTDVVTTIGITAPNVTSYLGSQKPLKTGGNMVLALCE